MSRATPSVLGQDPGRRQLQAWAEGTFKDQGTQGALDPLMQVQPLKLGIVEAYLQRFEFERVWLPVRSALRE